MRKVLGLAGPSNSGKTTAIETLIRHFVASGTTVAAIKHTHHAIGSEQRGDTLRFQQAGAEPVILAGDGRAVVFSRRGVEHVEFGTPSELLDRLDSDVVLIEGFKTASSWPAVELRANEWRTLEDLLQLF